MASDSDEPISDEEKIRIASDFILCAPPGEFNEVFNDVRVLLNDDSLLKEGAFRAIAQYNKNQLTPVKTEVSNVPTLVTDYNDMGNGRFYDPRSQVSFRYDHLRKEAFEVKKLEPDSTSEPWRAALEDSLNLYCQDHYPHGVCCVFSSTSDDGVITLNACIEDHEFQAKNFWNGRWRSIWSTSFSPNDSTGEITAKLMLHIHYYEDGNVALVSSKDIKETFQITSEQETAAEIMQVVETAETEYQVALSENYQTMSDTTFKALRRLLPVTRTKIDWTKILSYKLGTELKHH